eukprot:469359-Rhodomonas_salina.2
MSGTDLAYGGTMCHARTGTSIAYAATMHYGMSGTDLRVCCYHSLCDVSIWSCTAATQCSVLSKRMLLPYATQSKVLTYTYAATISYAMSSTDLRVCCQVGASPTAIFGEIMTQYAMSGTDLPYDAGSPMRCPVLTYRMMLPGCSVFRYSTPAVVLRGVRS